MFFKQFIYIYIYNVPLEVILLKINGQLEIIRITIEPSLTCSAWSISHLNSLKKLFLRVLTLIQVITVTNEYAVV